ncbi:hypothetical protein PI124_g22264 [Phytophthora idaei]|nr:hypothetical protein PI126_g22099 [Phytophthora idaei]KAG3232655.1 hypothetical protein PI124_g22264 [Phytophthora idaei]
MNGVVGLEQDYGGGISTTARKDHRGVPTTASAATQAKLGTRPRAMKAALVPLQFPTAATA